MKVTVSFLKELDKPDLTFDEIDDIAVSQGGFIVLLRGSGKEGKPQAYIPVGAVAAVYSLEGPNLIQGVHGVLA